MPGIRRLMSSVLLFALVLACTRLSSAAEWAQAEKTLSPYFVVKNGDPKLDALPLKSTRVELRVSGPIADVTVTQTYENHGKRPIDASYVFPASTRAAVHGMRMVIGKQIIEAEIQERKAAKKTFEAAKKAGKSASLLEQQRPNVFSMSVANVMPGDRIDVTLEYTELLVPTAGLYELVYPTVVGPRYSSQPEATAPATDQFVASPYTAEGKPPSATLQIVGSIASGLTVQNVGSPSHEITRKRPDAKLVRFALKKKEQAGGNRDFVLRYQLGGKQIETGLSLYDHGGEKFFLLMVAPPQRVTPDELPPREYVFVLDISGSMSGFPLDTAKQVLKRLVAELRPMDKFNVLLFSGGSYLLSPRSLPATRANLEQALDVIDRQRGGGGTELLAALNRALGLSPEPGLSRSFVVVTDGYVAADKRVMDHVRGHLNEANVYCIGIGSSVNRYLIEGIAKAGLGEPFVVTDPSQAASVADRFHRYVSTPVLTDVKVKAQGFDVYDVEPKSIPDVLAERPVVVHGKWRGAPKGVIRVTGTSGHGAYAKVLNASQVKPLPENEALPYLWARERIASLSDFSFVEPGEVEKKQITELGLRYSLLTRYTSFVAVSKIARNPGDPTTAVKQPLALPQGVSALAVGTPVHGSPEPELWLILAGLLGGVIVVGLRRRQALS